LKADGDGEIARWSSRRNLVRIPFALARNLIETDGRRPPSIRAVRAARAGRLMFNFEQALLTKSASDP
jgi:hypothetical protein